MQKNSLNNKPKLKHNKKRNTAFLYETLVKELTKAVVYGDKNKQKFVSTLIKEHFKKNGPLDRELTLYKQIYETRKFPTDRAEKLLDQVKEDHNSINENDIYNEQSKLIAKINKNLGPGIYSNFVPNYKTLASISQMFNRSIEPKRRVLLEHELLQYITGDEIVEKKDLKPIDNLTYQRFVDRFNEAYSNALLPEQKELLSRYIRHSEDDIDLKVYLNEELWRLKGVLKEVSGTEIVKENIDLNDNFQKMSESIQNLQIETINESLIKKIMLIQEFVHEVQK